MLLNGVLSIHSCKAALDTGCSDDGVYTILSAAARRFHAFQSMTDGYLPYQNFNSTFQTKTVFSRPSILLPIHSSIHLSFSLFSIRAYSYITLYTTALIDLEATKQVCFKFNGKDHQKTKYTYTASLTHVLIVEYFF